MSKTYKVYVVLFRNFYDEEEYCGVFDTKEKAQHYINGYAPHIHSSFTIIEEDVDES